MGQNLCFRLVACKKEIILPQKQSIEFRDAKRRPDEKPSLHPFNQKASHRNQTAPLYTQNSANIYLLERARRRNPIGAERGGVSENLVVLCVATRMPARKVVLLHWDGFLMLATRL
jgi:hypothetical protein